MGMEEGIIGEGEWVWRRVIIGEGNGYGGGHYRGGEWYGGGHYRGGGMDMEEGIIEEKEWVWKRSL